MNQTFTKPEVKEDSRKQESGGGAAHNGGFSSVPIEN